MFKRIAEAVRNNQAGFTLIELLAVMAIVGVLAGIVTTSVSGTSEAGQDAQVAQDTSTVFNAANEYFSDQDGVSTISEHSHDVLDLKLGNPVPDNVLQKITGLWPEKAFGVGQAYPGVFPSNNAAAGGAHSVTFLDDDGITTYQIIDRATGSGKDVGLKVFLQDFSAIDFNTLVANGYMDAAPASHDALVGDLFNLYLWLFEKATTPGGNSDDARDVTVFRLQSITEVDGKFDLQYKHFK